MVVTILVGIATPARAARPGPNTVLDSGPASSTSSTSASFTFHSTLSGATFACTLDAGASVACTSPKAHTGLAAGSHTFSVTSTAKGRTDPSPAAYTWTIDTMPPTAPTDLEATTSTATSVTLTWTAGMDNTGVTGYDVFRDGSLLTSLGAVASYTDNVVVTGSTYSYAVRAKDAAANVSQLSETVSTSPMPAPDPHLTRAPYLTDLVGLNAIVNFGTDRSASVATVLYGAVGSDGSCAPTTSVSATHLTVAVGTVYEYQWKARLTLPASGSYCYRPFLGATDLLGANTSPRVTTQVPLGSAEPYSFAVFGDWGQSYAPGGNTNQANLMAQLASSGVRFAITTGDNGYPAGSQLNYGDLQQTGANVSAIFGPQQWGVPGASIPLFPAIGNHGLARSDATHPHFANWPQDTAVATSGGSYVSTSYPSVDGTKPATYPSPWYAFDAGNARFYVLDAAWADFNPGTVTPHGDYAAEKDSHWTPTSPEYVWLQKDLAAHPSGLKFAFFHYPLYSDQPSESSDTYLQGASGLEGLLSSYGVDIAFQGHAHIYQRSTGLGGLISYLTGGGGAQAQSTRTGASCDAIHDRYAIGWSYTKNAATTCGAAVEAAPTSDAQVYHFLKVTVSGTYVTVTPTDSTGRTFDVQTYSFQPRPDTFIDSTPPAGSPSTDASFAFHASSTSATFACQLDHGTPTSCTSPVTYTGLAQTVHTFSVVATVDTVQDPLPAMYSWTVDATAPSAPSNVTATAQSPFQVSLGWTASTDNTGVTGYDLFRDGVLYQSLGVVSSFTDTSVLGSTTLQYAVRARDVAGNVSAFSTTQSVTTPPPPEPLFADGFETGTLSRWNATGGLTVESTTVHGGAHAVEGTTQNGGTYAKVSLPDSFTSSWARLWFTVLAQPDQVNLLRFRDALGNSLGYVYVGTTGQLGFHDDATGTNTLSGSTPAPGWHSLELHLDAASTPGAPGVVQIWLDNVMVADLSSATAYHGSTPVGILQIGEVQSGLTYRVAFDDVAFGTSRLGPVADSTPPSAPGSVTAWAPSAFSTQVSWVASTDSTGISSYDVFRDGTFVGDVPATATSFTDTTVLSSTTYSYTVRAWDVSGNVSPLSAATSVTTPSAPPPLFADGFESGLGAWSSTRGLVLEPTDVHSGGFAAEGAATNGGISAKKTLPAGSYPDAYARVWVEMKTLPNGNTGLLRLRDTASGSVGNVFLTSGGKLGFSGGTITPSTTSNVRLGSGWHAIELHVSVNGASSSYQVWLDGAPVTGLAGTLDLTGSGSTTILQVGDSAAVTGRTFDVVYDDAAFATSRVGI